MVTVGRAGARARMFEFDYSRTPVSLCQMDQSEEQASALEPTLGDAASPASRRAVVQLAALPRAAQVLRLFHYAKWDLGNLVRCALAAGASVHSCMKPADTPVLCLAAQEGSARALSALLTGAS